MIANSYTFKNGISFIPRLGIFIESDPDNSIERFKGDRIFIENGKELDLSIFKNLKNVRENEICNRDISWLCIVPTTECHGRCSYCYAKDGRDQKFEYLSPEILSEKIDSFKDTLESIVIYGGDAFVEPEKLEKLINIFSDDVSICIVTGFLYSEEIFKSVIILLKKYRNISLCISIDPKHEPYSRILPGEKDVYSMIFSRIKTIISEIDYAEKRIGYRVTLTENSYNFEDIVEQLEEIYIDKKNIEITVEFAFEEEKDISSLLAIEAFKSMSKIHDRIGKPFISPARRFLFNPLTSNIIVHSFGDCAQMYSEITIDQFGNFHGCNESPTQSNKSSFIGTSHNDESEALRKERSKIKDQCIDCDFLYLCGGFCFKHKNKDVECTWRKLSILEAIYWSVGRLKKDHIKDFIAKNNKGIKIIEKQLLTIGE